MASFTEISQEVWRSSIPIELVIADNDLSSSIRPHPCFLLISRMSYLGVIAADTVDFFKSYAIDLDSEVWFESDGSPLKWYDALSLLRNVNGAALPASERSTLITATP